jgi:hypothetical protein
MAVTVIDVLEVLLVCSNVHGIYRTIPGPQGGSSSWLKCGGVEIVKIWCAPKPIKVDSLCQLDDFPTAVFWVQTYLIHPYTVPGSIRQISRKS